MPITSSLAISGKELCFRLNNHSLNEFAYKKMNDECAGFKEGFFEKSSTICLLRSTLANSNFGGQTIYQDCLKNNKTVIFYKSFTTDVD